MSDLSIKFNLTPTLDVQALNAMLKRLKESLGEAGKDLNLIDVESFNKDMEELRKQAEEIAKANEEVVNSTEEITISLDKSKTSADLFTKAFKFNMILDAMDRVQSAVANLSSHFISYESSLAEVGAITGFTGDKLDVLGTKARELSTNFGSDVNDQLKSFSGVLSKLGPDIANNADALALLGNNINILSQASGDTVASSMQSITDAMLQMGLASGTPLEVAQNSTDVINALAASAQVGSAEIVDVANALVVAGSSAKNANLDLVDVNSAIQVLAIGGKRGAEAGTALRNVIGLLQKATGPAEEALNQLGLSSEQLGKALTEQGIESALAELQKGLSSLSSDYEKNNALIRIFGMENQTAVSILLDNVDKFKEFSTGIKEGMEGTGSAFEQAEIRMNTTEGTLSVIKAHIDDIFIGIGSTIGSTATTLLNIGGQIAPTVATLGTLKTAFPTEQAKNFAKTVIGKVVPSLIVQEGQNKKLVISKKTLSAISLKDKKLEVASLIKSNALKVKDIGLTVAKTTATKIATASQWMLNAARSADPVYLILAGTVALTGALITLAYVSKKTADDRIKDGEAELKHIDKQIDGYNKKKQAIENQSSLINQYEELSKKANRTAEEERKLTDITIKLSKIYPNTISSTKSYADNLIALRKRLKEGTDEVKKFEKELKTIEQRKLQIEVEIAQANVDKVSENIADEDVDGTVKAWIGKFAENMKTASSSEELEQIKQKAEKFIFTSPESADLTPQQRANLQKHVDNAYKHGAKVLENKKKATANTINNVMDAIVGNIDPSKIDKETKRVYDIIQQNGGKLTNELKNQLATTFGLSIDIIDDILQNAQKKANNTKINTAESIIIDSKKTEEEKERLKSLISEYEAGEKRMTDLKQKQNRGELTKAEAEEYENLKKKQIDTADTIQKINPALVKNTKTLIDANGELINQYDIQIDKAKEYANSTDNSDKLKAVKDIEEAVKSETTALGNNIKAREEQRKAIENAKTPEEAKKAREEYEKYNKRVKDGTNLLVDDIRKVAEVGGNVNQSIADFAKNIGISNEEAKKMVIADELEEARKNGNLTNEVIENTAKKYGVSAEKVKQVKQAQDEHAKSVKNAVSNVNDLANAYAQVGDKLQKNIEHNKKMFVALKDKEGKVGLTAGEKEELKKFTEYLAYGNKQLERRNKIEEEANNLGKRKSSGSSSAKVDDFEKTLKEHQKRTRENLNKQALEDIDNQNEKEKQKLIEGYKKKEEELSNLKLEYKKKYSAEKYATIEQVINEELESEKILYLQALDTLNVKIFKKEIEDQRKLNEEKIKEEKQFFNELSNLRLESLKDAETSASGDSLIANLQAQKEIRIKTIKEQAEAEKKARFESTKEYKDYISSITTWQAQIKATELAISEAQKTGDTKRVEKLNNDMVILKSNIDTATNAINLFRTPFLNSETIKLIDEQAIASISKITKEIDTKEVSIKLAQSANSVAEYKKNIALKKAQETLQEELRLAHNNEELILEAYKNFNVAKQKIDEEYFSNSLMLQDLVYNSMLQFSKSFTQSLMENTVNPIEQAIDELNKKLSEVNKDVNDEAKNQRKKDLEDFKEQAKNKVISHSQMIEQLSKLNKDYEKKTEESNKNILQLQIGLLKGFNATAGVFNKASSANLEKTNTKVVTKLEELKDKGELNTKAIVETLKENIDGYKQFGINVAGESIAQFGALISAGEDFGSAFRKGILVNLIKHAQSTVASSIPSIYAWAYSSMPPALATISATGTIALIMSALEVAKSKIAGYKTGVVNLKGHYNSQIDRDDIPAMLTKGESVITRKATQANIDEFNWVNITGKNLADYYVNNKPDIIIEKLKNNGKITDKIMRNVMEIKVVKNIEISKENQIIKEELISVNDKLNKLIEVNERGNFNRKSATKVNVDINTNDSAIISNIKTKLEKDILFI